MAGIYIDHSSLISFISSHASLLGFVNKLVKDTNAFTRFFFIGFMDCSNIRIYQFVTKVYKSQKISNSINMGIIQVKYAADST